MSAWTFAFVVTTMLGMLVSIVVGRREPNPHRERVSAWSLMIAAGSTVGITVSVALAEPDMSLFRAVLVAATVAFAVATIHNETRRLIDTKNE